MKTDNSEGHTWTKLSSSKGGYKKEAALEAGQESSSIQNLITMVYWRVLNLKLLSKAGQLVKRIIFNTDKSKSTQPTCTKFS